MNRPTKISLIIISIAIASFLSICFLFFSALLGYVALTNPNPPQIPATYYGEFPFKLVYEINGEQKTIEDTLVIEYQGYRISAGSLGTLENDWNAYLERRKDEQETQYYYTEQFVLLDNYIDGCHIRIEFDVGSCEYYMGLEEADVFSYIYRYGTSAGDFILFSPEYEGRISEEELYDEFGIKIIEKQISKPLTGKPKNGTRFDILWLFPASHFGIPLTK